MMIINININKSQIVFLERGQFTVTDANNLLIRRVQCT